MPNDLTSAVALHKQGNLDQAEALYLNLLKAEPRHADALQYLGMLHAQRGQAESAIDYLQQALASAPQHFAALCNLGMMLTNVQRFAPALEQFDRALQVQPDSAQIWHSRGNVLLALQRPAEACESYRRAVAINPEFVEAYFNLATTLSALGQLADAAASFRRVLEIKPELAEVHINLAITLGALGQLDGAVESYRRALALKPGFAEVHYNLGSTLKDLGQLDEAVASFRLALEIKPDFAEAHNNLGLTLQGCGQLDGAAASFRRALESKPDFAEAHNNLGLILQDRGQLDDAMASFRRALEIMPNFAEACCNLGNTLHALSRLDDAMASYRRALEIKPDYAEAQNNLGNILKEFGRLDDALACYRRALEIKPDYAMAHSNLLFAHNYLAVQPAAMLLAEARHFGELAARKASPAQTWPNIPDAGRCLRVGLVSGDFYAHPVGYFIENVLAALASHACGRLELVGYSNYSRTDALTERIKACCCGWHSTVGLSDAQLAQRIRDDGIDILIDLSGHTAHNRLPMFAWKPAPVQASWLGYFATTGITAIDYLIADPWTLPKAEEANFTETIWRLPETRLCFTPPDANVEVSPLPALANGMNRITFGCFNDLGKMNDAVVALWAKVLNAVPQSRLFIKAKQLVSATIQQSVLERFAVHGIGADKLMLEGPSSRLDYFSAYHRVDIALDPFPYTGGTTTAEACWMGVPVLTLTGEHFLARQGVGLLMNAGLPEWIATDAADYVARAVSHAGDLPRLAALRAGLRQQLLASPLCDAPRFARHFEAALRSMWTQWCDRERFDPKLVEAHINQGNALLGLGRLEEAAASYRRALEIDPNFAEVHYNLANVLRGLRQLDGAVASYRRALQIKPDLAGAHNNLGLALQDLGQFEEAAASTRRALDIKPDYALAHNNLGNALLALGRIEEAAASYRRALEIKPDFALAHNNLGNVLQELGRLDDAAASFRRALAINPDLYEAHDSLLYCINLNEAVDAEALFAEHCRYGQQFEAPLRAGWPQHRNLRDPERRLRIGFVSADLNQHALASFFEPLLARLVEFPGLSLTIYYNNTREDPMMQRLRGMSTQWHAIAHLTDAAVAQKIVEDGIDILIDLSGHTSKNRLLSFARKPAPVQASWMGYPGTTGLQAMDYFLADRFFMPPGQFDAQFTEKIVRLPATAPFLPNPTAPPVNALPAMTNGYVTFGSFNRMNKLSPAVIALWSQLLRALPDARMVLGGMPENGNNDTVIDWFQQQGIARERLSFYPRSPMPAYLALHHRVDICLDTFPYAGSTTTLHALWMGVPTLTLAGRTLAGRAGATILGCVGLDEFVALNHADFVQKGLAAAADIPALAQLRAELRERFAESAISRPEVIAAGLERALRIMWQRWCAGLPAESFEVR